MIECPPASANPSSHPMGLSNTCLQIASTFSALGSRSASASVGVTSRSSVSCALGGARRSPFRSSSDRSGKHLRSIFPDTGCVTNFSTRNILVGTEGAGSCLARVAVTRAAHSAGAGATTEISPANIEGAMTKATSASFW